MNLERTKFITAVILYGTIGLFLRYVSIPTEIVVMCRGIIGSIFILAYLKLTDRRINITAIDSTFIKVHPNATGALKKTENRA